MVIAGFAPVWRATAEGASATLGHGRGVMRQSQSESDGSPAFKCGDLATTLQFCGTIDSTNSAEKALNYA
jgi:hypothetical protein